MLKYLAPKFYESYPFDYEKPFGIIFDKRNYFLKLIYPRFSFSFSYSDIGLNSRKIILKNFYRPLDR